MQCSTQFMERPITERFLELVANELGFLWTMWTRWTMWTPVYSNLQPFKQPQPKRDTFCSVWAAKSTPNLFPN